MSLENLINKLKPLITDDNTEQNISLNKFQLENWTSQYYVLFGSSAGEWKIILLFFYSLIILVSFFGNSIVCKIVFWNSAMRSTTNIYIGNLSVSDLLMTVLNIPLQLTQIFSRNWPLSQLLCRCMPFFQCLSVNVSSFTMACIALDRYQVIVHPLKPKSTTTSIILKIIFIWVMATITSTPYPAIAGVEDDFTYSRVTRCRLIYPEPKIQVRQSLTVITVIIQYIIPLCITGVTYCKICYIIWNRRSIGVMSERQINQRYMAKWKTIKMLIIVFGVFAICWFPLNMYHMYQDFRGIVDHNKHNPRIFLICHWFAMSSVCYNPFVYCWLNERFRARTKAYFRWILRINPSTNLRYNSVFAKNIDRSKGKHSRKTSTISMSTDLKYSYHRPNLVQHSIEKDEVNDQHEKERNSENKMLINISVVASNITENKFTSTNSALINGNMFINDRETHV